MNHDSKIKRNATKKKSHRTVSASYIHTISNHTQKNKKTQTQTKMKTQKNQESNLNFDRHHLFLRRRRRGRRRTTLPPQGRQVPLDPVHRVQQRHRDTGDLRPEGGQVDGFLAELVAPTGRALYWYTYQYFFSIFLWRKERERGSLTAG